MQRLILMLMVSIAVVACGPGADTPTPDEPPASVPGDPGPGSDVDVVTIETRLVGLPLVDAEAQAEMWGLPLRVARVDDDVRAVTDDHVVGRITVEVDTIDGVQTVTGLSVETDPDA